MAEHAARVPGLAVATEVGGAVIVDGEPDRHLGMVHRRLPALAPGEVALPFSVLAAPSPATGNPVAVEVVEAGYGGDPEAFVEELARLVLAPVLGWLNLGIALEAHGQNLLAVARGGRLDRLIYRDFGGVRVNPKLLLDNGIERPALRGDVPTDDPEVLRTKLLAAAVASVLWQVIATLQRYGLDETRAWERVAAVARQLPGAERAGLFAPDMPIKAYVAMRLAEAAIEDIWCEGLANQMGGLA